jgi:hypothetical protein
VGVICVGECEGGGGEVAEEALLDLGVGLERAVVVEVIVVEAGEDAAVEVDACDPLLVDRVRGHLHEAVAAAGAHHHRQEPLQLDRGWRGVVVGMTLAADANARGGDQSASLAESGEELMQQRRDRGLAVRAGDTDDRQQLRRAPVDPDGLVDAVRAGESRVPLQGQRETIIFASPAGVRWTPRGGSTGGSTSGSPGATQRLKREGCH